MAAVEYRRRLEIHQQKLAFGDELLQIAEESSGLKELQDSSATVTKMVEKIEKVEAKREELKRAVLEKTREIEEETRAEFVAATGQEGQPDIEVLKEKVQCVGEQVTEKEKNCQKLEREKQHLDHDRKYHKVLKGIAAVNFDKNSTDTCVKGYIQKADGELYVFEYDLEKEDRCAVANTLWDNL